jgi:hypothetical protein
MINSHQSLHTKKAQKTSQQLQPQSNQAQLWEEIGDTPAEKIQGGLWPDPTGGWLSGVWGF